MESFRVAWNVSRWPGKFPGGLKSFQVDLKVSRWPGKFSWWPGKFSPENFPGCLAELFSDWGFWLLPLAARILVTLWERLHLTASQCVLMENGGLFSAPNLSGTLGTLVVWEKDWHREAKDWHRQVARMPLPAICQILHQCNHYSFFFLQSRWDHLRKG